MTPIEEFRAAIDKLTTAEASDINEAQVAILLGALVEDEEATEYWAEVGKQHLRGPSKIVPLNIGALALARAINGQEQQ